MNLTYLMYDTLKKCDRLKEKWTRKVQILSKKQHSVTDLGLTLKHNCFFLLILSEFTFQQSMLKKILYIIQIKRVYQKGFSASMTFL